MMLEDIQKSKRQPSAVISIRIPKEYADYIKSKNISCAKIVMKTIDGLLGKKVR